MSAPSLNVSDHLFAAMHHTHRLYESKKDLTLLANWVRESSVAEKVLKSWSRFQPPNAAITLHPLQAERTLETVSVVNGLGLLYASQKPEKVSMSTNAWRQLGQAGHNYD